MAPVRCTAMPNWPGTQNEMGFAVGEAFHILQPVISGHRQEAMHSPVKITTPVAGSSVRYP
jgi:hypothetical protein